MAEQVEIQIKYAGYIARQDDEVPRHESTNRRAFPQQLDYDAVRGLSIEVRQKLQVASSGNGRPGLAHFGRDTGSDLAPAGARQATSTGRGAGNRLRPEVAISHARPGGRAQPSSAVALESAQLDQLSSFAGLARCGGIASTT